MLVVKSIIEMQKISNELKKNGQTLACVPTMGYLHNGHLSLIQKGKELADKVVTTLFVNPTQFAPNEDFSRYPRDFDKDYKNAKEAGSDYLFFPDVLEMYPIGFSTTISIKNISEKFEGEFRPGHFDGVATVVAKLLNATNPHIAIFGQKDYQQTLLVRRLVKDLNMPIDIFVAPTLRESNGLAMSSRNTYLSTEDKNTAGIIFTALENAKLSIANGERSRKVINAIMHKILRSVPNIRLDYAASALADSLETPDIFLAGDNVVLLIALYLGKTRLIDNSLIQVPYSNQS
jgi:pantoate--beta-alanine ligase